MGRGEEMDGERNCAAPDSQRLGEAEDLLQPHREDRPALGTVVDWQPAAARHVGMGRCQPVELSALPPVEEMPEELAHGEATEIGAPAVSAASIGAPKTGW